MVKVIDLSSQNWHIIRSDFYVMFHSYVYVCLVTFFAENLATFLEMFFSNQDIKIWPIFFLAVSYFLRYTSFFERFFGFSILFLQIIFADKKLCKFKQSFINSYIFILKFGSIFMFGGCCKTCRPAWTMYVQEFLSTLLHFI